MKSRSQHLLDHSIGMALSAIEIYNKPDFKQREQVFAVLLTAAWESLFKAKILKDSGNRMSSLWVRQSGTKPGGIRYKRNRNGQPLTMDIFSAMLRCSVHAVVRENLDQLVAIRDAAVHLTAASAALAPLMFQLGAASLKNYQKLVKDWFARSLNDYNMFILPLAFKFPFRRFSLVELSNEPVEVLAVLQAVAKAGDADVAASDDFALVCDMKIELVSAKKIADMDGLTAAVHVATGGAVAVRDRNLTDLYQLTYQQLVSGVLKNVPGARAFDVQVALKTLGLKGNRKYSAYNFVSKAAEAKGATKNTPVVYNHDSVAFVSAFMREKT